MTRFALYALPGVLCFCALALHGQTYHIYRPLPQKFSAPPVLKDNRAEVSVSGLSSWGLLKDIAGDSVSAHMEGVRVRVSARGQGRLSVGAEGAYMASFDHPALLAHMRRQSLAVFARWTLTPNARPVLYVFASGGAVYNQSKFVYSRENLNQWSGSFSFGAGQTWKITERWALEAEYRLSYDLRPWQNFAFSAPAWRAECSVGLSGLLF